MRHRIVGMCVIAIVALMSLVFWKPSDVRAASNLEIISFFPSTTVFQGSPISIQVHVINHGPDSATNAQLVITPWQYPQLFDGFTYTSVTKSPGTTFDRNTGVWTLGTLGVENEKTAIINFSVSETATLGSRPDLTAVFSADGENDVAKIISPSIVVEAAPPPPPPPPAPDVCTDPGGFIGSDAYTNSSRWPDEFCLYRPENKSIDGNGWIPVDLASMPGGSPISALPVDPINTISNLLSPSSTDPVYRYACQNDVSGTGKSSYVFEINVVLESDAFTKIDNKAAKDGGDDDNIFELGTSLRLIGSLVGVE